LIQWGDHRLGDNDNRPTGGQQSDALVLLIRGDLLRKYSVVVYAVEARGPEGAYVPGLAEFAAYFPNETASTPIRPIFSGTLKPDLGFYGFPFSEDDVRRKTARFAKGLYFILEERPSEAHFGVDEPSAAEPDSHLAPLANWDDLSWANFSAEGDGVALPPGAYINAVQPAPLDATAAFPYRWGDGPAAIAAITVQKPVRVAVAAERMLVDER